MRNAFWALCLAGLLFGCAGTSGSGSSNGRVEVYNNDLGIATNYGIQDQTQEILVNKYHFEVLYYDDTSNRVYVETDWKERTPFEDERHQGVLQAKSRIILEARPRGRTGETSRMSVRFKGENLLYFSDTASWERGHMTRQCRAYFKEIANELKTRFATLVREY